MARRRGEQPARRVSASGAVSEPTATGAQAFGSGGDETVTVDTRQTNKRASSLLLKMAVRFTESATSVVRDVGRADKHFNMRV